MVKVLACWRLQRTGRFIRWGLASSWQSGMRSPLCRWMVGNGMPSSMSFASQTLRSQRPTSAWQSRSWTPHTILKHRCGHQHEVGGMNEAVVAQAEDDGVNEVVGVVVVV